MYQNLYNTLNTTWHEKKNTNIRIVKSIKKSPAFSLDIKTSNRIIITWVCDTGMKQQNYFSWYLLITREI